MGPAGRIAQAWVDSKLTPLFIIASIALGAFSVWRLPREEEPQIVVPMIDVFVGLPGASPKEVEERVTRPMERLLWEIPGVEYLYSTSSPGGSLAIVRFRVGEDEEKSLVRLNEKLSANLDKIPPGATMPMVKPRSIDNVPILALTLSSSRYDSVELRRIAAQVREVVQQANDVSETTLIGGQRREVRVTVDESRLAAYGLGPARVWSALQGANRKIPSGSYARMNRETLLDTGDFLKSAAEVRRVVVAAVNQRPVFVEDVAEVADTGEEPSQYVQFAEPGKPFEAAVTISVAKRKGANAIDVADDVLKRVEAQRGSLVPGDVKITPTRQYGETAAEKSNELLYHMAIAVVSVSILIALALGLRESLIVFTAIPVTLALTLTVFYLYGYTLNRITLFALIFSIGILVDDAIVVVENIVRHRNLPENRGKSLSSIAVKAVDEVGNPTILATMTVVAAILPMAFVRGLMGPYMRPIPIGASAAMLFSLAVAFLVTPWAAIRILRAHGGHAQEQKEDRLTRGYRRFMGALLEHGPTRWTFLGGVVVLLLGAMALVYIGFVKVKMLPFDNKSEFQVIIDMPEGTPLEETARVAQALAEQTLKMPEVVNVQTYAGTASPYNFNGLVRHYYLRSGSNVADIQVNLLGKKERSRQSHEIAKEVRTKLLPLAQHFGARMKVAEVPPGPPVLETIVAEVYGPSQKRQLETARKIRNLFRSTEGIVDVDWYVEDDQPKETFDVDREKAALNGVSVEDVARTVRIASHGEPSGLLHVPNSREDVPITVRLSRASRTDVGAIETLRVGPVPLSEVSHLHSSVEEKSIYHKNLLPVTYVVADVAGTMESPVYAILKLGPEIDRMGLPQFTARQPDSSATQSIKWDGEWHITYEVFRDLGAAFAAVLVLIYILVVGWFESFSVPLVIMAVIPMSLVGILPAHGLMRGFFTATSMIGFIAGAGIVVRNSIILVDFIQLRVREGMPLKDAVIDAGAVRFRPMLLTAAAVVVGSTVILFDPIFQGLAISLMAGEIASLALSRMTVPVLYFLLRKGEQHV